MKIRKYDLILGLLIIAEIVLCFYVGYSGSNNYLCTTGSSCSFVQNSIYGTLFGIKLAWFGLVSFSIFFILFLIARFKKNIYWAFLLATIIGAVFAVYFISLQLFVLKQICNDCITIDGIMVIMMIIVIFEFVDFRKELKNVAKTVEKEMGKAL